MCFFYIFVCKIGKYYLVDTGYSNEPGFLVAYKTNKQQKTSQANKVSQFHGPHELFNYRHSSIRNVIERTFGVLKKRFPVIKDSMPPYKKMAMQGNIVIACCVVHNFIRENDLDDFCFSEVEMGNGTSSSGGGGDDGAEQSYVDNTTLNFSSNELRHWAAYRELIADQIWNDHIA